MEGSGLKLEEGLEGAVVPVKQQPVEPGCAKCHFLETSKTCFMLTSFRTRKLDLKAILSTQDVSFPSK